MAPKFQSRSVGFSKASSKSSSKYTKNEDEDPEISSKKRFEDIAKKNEIDNQMGFPMWQGGSGSINNNSNNNNNNRVGWMINMQTTLLADSEWPSGRSGVDYYFMSEDGSCWKSTLLHSPYFFIKCKPGTESEVEDYLGRRFQRTIESMEKVMKEDLDLSNHLAGIQRSYLQVSFRNVNDMMTVRKFLLPAAQKHGENYRDGVLNVYQVSEDIKKNDSKYSTSKRSENDSLSNIVDLREYDLPYHLRASIDNDIRVGLWYDVSVKGPSASIKRIATKDVRPDPVVFAFDIECCKLPLKFPDAAQDEIMMISYMINGRGYLIVNREVVSKDIEPFEYTPKPDFPGHFETFNVADEEAVLKKFFSHIQLVQPQIFVTYNGDFFDWPYIEKRAEIHSMDMFKTIGISSNSQGEYGGSYCVHMDCFCWVKRDSYLPAGSHGLKAVCSIKLGYDPLELDPEQMTPLARDDPHTLANYSVSDAVATFYLYMKYIHPFIFSLCNIIPLMPDEVLRKGTGTLCETLLMAEATKANVIMPNKYTEKGEKFFNGHLLESETYIGGHVEALEAGVYRSDFDYKFSVDGGAIDSLVEDLDRALTFFIQHESKLSLDQVCNYEEIKQDITQKLVSLQQKKTFNCRPLIYHLDVGSMYPNIILTNRLQPSAMVDESTCAVCDFNKPGKQCQRKMGWSWRGEFYTAKQNEYKMIKKQLESEQFPSKRLKGTTIPFHQLSESEQKALLKKRLADYSQKIYKRAKNTKVVAKQSIVCQRENSFYIDTVRRFRDRRYEYKNLQKQSKKKAEIAKELEDIVGGEEAGKLVVLYDSLQLAHKCILNSFYGYVMRKAARWYSMEMGGIVCDTGASIITLARVLIEKIGRPLELDTDGIWCMLPFDFPQDFSFQLSSGKTLSFSYPCVMLNHLVYDKFTNNQYQTLQSDGTYSISSENSIFFEVDGPYKAMVLPSSTEEGRQLKKRYAVFNEDGSLAELKGFEIKRRGELKLVKIFQSELFKTFLLGDNLKECYGEVARIANYWLDILMSKGESLQDFELIELISENRSMSKSLAEYGSQKSTSICTAKRLAEFLGDSMVKDKGLACKFVISAKPAGQPVASRAIPVAIFSAAEPVKNHFLTKWLRDSSLTAIREIIDWDYYIERVGSMIQKLIVIPAAMQSVSNPVPRVMPPDWLKKSNRLASSKMKQKSLTDMFSKMAAPSLIGDKREISPVDIEDITQGSKAKNDRASQKTLDSQQSKIPSKRIDPEKDYSGWVASQKQDWIRLITKISQNDSYSCPPSGKKLSLKNLAGRQKELLLKTPWQIISIEQSEALGLYNVWCIVGGSLKLLSINCPRVFYLGMSKEWLGNHFAERVYRKTIGSSPPYIYRVTQNEQEFHDKFISNSATFLDPSIDDIWEANIPLDFHLLTNLGCVSKNNVEMNNLSEQDSFSIEQFSFLSTNEQSYLQNGIVYMFVAMVESHDDRAVVITTQSDSNVVKVFVVDKGLRKQLPNLQTIFPSIPSKDIFSFENPKIQVEYYKDKASAFKDIRKLFNVYLDRRPSPTIIITPNDKIQIQTITKQFPIIQFVPWLPSFLIPPLDWQRNSVKHLFEYLKGINENLAGALKESRYSHLPLATIASCKKKSVLISDVFLARTLLRQGYILPWNIQSNLTSTTTSKSCPLNYSHSSGKAFNFPAMYRCVTVDFDISGLALNSLLEYPHICAESGGGAGELPGNGNLLAMLRVLSTNWLKESLNIAGSPQAERPFSNVLISGIYYWITSGSSRILPNWFAERIGQILQLSLEKLVDFVRNLGCLIVYADTNRLIIQTAKTNYENSQAFVEFLVNEIKQTDGLAWISMAPCDYWKCLLWLDSANYAGISCSSSSKQNSVSSRWNIAEYLPPLLQSPFNLLVGEYLMKTFAISASSLKKAENKENASIELVDEDEWIDDVEVTGNILEKSFKNKILAAIREIQKIFSGVPSSQSDAISKAFPTLIGSHMKLENAPLQFLNFLSRVFNLDTILKDETFTTIKNAYCLLGVKEFSDKVTFENPCRSFVLPSVVCSQCFYARSMDFCRDFDILSSMSSNVKTPQCPSCNHPYNISSIESHIIQQLQAEESAYYTLDLECTKCKAIKADSMVSYCGCSGGFRLIGSDFMEKIPILNRISKALNLITLQLFIESNYNHFLP